MITPNSDSTSPESVKSLLTESDSEKPRYAPSRESVAQSPCFSRSTLDHLIANLTIEPFFESRSHGPSRPDDALGVSLEGSLYKVVKEASGVPAERLHDTMRHSVFPRFTIRLDAEGLDTLQASGLIYGLEKPLESHYLLQVAEDGRVHAKYQTILGGRNLGTFKPDQLQALQQKAAELIAERDLTYAPLYSAMQDKRASQALAEVAGDNLVDQLKALCLDGADVRLPEKHLSQYKTIREVMLNAGGEYKSNAQGSFFRFSDAQEAGDKLARIQAGERPNLQQETQFFATPDHLVALAVDRFMMPVAGSRFLEPSAGDGAMAKRLHSVGAGEVVCVENWAVNVAALKKAGLDPIEKDFLTVSPSEFELFDGALMNPPFTKGADIAHVRHALGFLKPTGELVAIMSPGFMTRQTSSMKNFADLMELADAEVEPIGAGAFKSSGTNVSTVMVHIRMADLLNSLEARQENGAEYGLDLSGAWKTHRSVLVAQRNLHP